MKKFKRVMLAMVVTLSLTAISALAQDDDPYPISLRLRISYRANHHRISNRTNQHRPIVQIRTIPPEERRVCSTCRDQFRSSRVGPRIGLPEV